MTTCVCGCPMVKVGARWICSNGECLKTAPTSPGRSIDTTAFSKAVSKWQPYEIPDTGEFERDDDGQTDGRWWV